MVETKRQSSAIRFERSKGKGGQSIYCRAVFSIERALRPAHSREHCDAFGDASGGAHRKQLSIAPTVTKLIMRRSLEIVIWVPAQADCRAVEALALAS